MMTIPAGQGRAVNNFADAPVQVQAPPRAASGVQGQPSISEEPTQEDLINSLKEPVKLESAISAAASSPEFENQVDRMNLEDTGKKIGEGVADAAFGTKQRRINVDEAEVEALQQSTLQAVDEHLASAAVFKPVATPLLKGMIAPIETGIQRNLDVNFCQAMVKVMFPWAACSKKQ
eukprot:TRINITY_DN2222_c1_g2_i3.p1 TRINITY_DN2222_c1_g2~~TRINITY_DN2222_c1_g2_i3.p1  ORF type:complete len:176 (-),score=36.17 TRINITY_DN2222_c1_g2_i3:1271-1798(-)